MSTVPPLIHAISCRGVTGFPYSRRGGTIRVGRSERMNRRAAAVWGHLVGDAIGVPYESTDPASVGVVELRGGGRHGQPAGTWSDDGALMLALLDSLTEVGFAPVDQARRSIAWAMDGAYTPDGDGMFDIGRTTAGALARARLPS